MTTQTPATEERLSRLEGAYEQVNERLGDLRTDMNERISELRADVTERLNELSRGQDSLRNTMLLLIGGVWTTMVGGFIVLFTRL